MARLRAGTIRAVAMAAWTLAAWNAQPAVAAQSASPDQLMGVFNSLSPDQQQQLMQQLGGAVGGGAAGGAAATQNRNAAGNSTAEGTQLQRRMGVNADGSSSTMVPSALLPLKPLDTVLLDVDFREEAPPQPNSQLGTQNTSPNTGLVQQAGVPQQNPPAQNANNSQQTTRARQEADELSAKDRDRLKILIDQLRERNPYTLDAAGRLLLPGFAPIPIAGLNEELATKRVSAEPVLLKLRVTLTRLPLAKSGLAALKPFGYDFFEDAPSTFAPLGDVPVPADYIVGAGDELNVQLYGSQNRTTRLVVQRDGRISFPEIGPIAVGGRTFNEVRNDIEARVSRQMIGTRASLSMGDSRSIRVFVMGEAKYPGSYTVSGLATVTGALFAAGGVKPIGSLRDIQVKRAGKLVRHIDLYDLLLQGDTGNDVSLLSGDVILIPPVSATITVDGEVRRPAIYETRPSTTVKDAVAMAGGFTSDADTARASMTRLNEQQQRVVVDVNPSAATNSPGMRNGDVLRVATVRPTLDSGVSVNGEVFRPGNFAWREGLRLTDVVGAVNELRPNADQHYLLIRRETGPDRRITAMSADLDAALAQRGGTADVLLMPRDQIIAFDLGASRDRLVKPLITELKLQAGPGAPAQIVTVSGRVKAAGDYPLDTGMHVADLVRAGGGLEDAAYGGRAELSRYAVENGQARRAQVISIDLAAVLRGDPAANLELQPFDGLFIKEISGWSEREQVVLKGEVRFPGTYPIKRGETLRSVIDRAGGLTDLAFVEGSVFTREELKVREQEQLDRLSDRLRNELATASLAAARANQTGAVQSYNIGQSLLDQLKNVKAVGRLVINMPTVLNSPAGGESDVILRDGDELLVPKKRQEVTVIGEVQNVTSHVFAASRSRDDYVSLSGGTTRQADRGKIYVVRADGSVVANSSGWLFRGGQPVIRTGDTIVVPLDTERTPLLPLWQSVTQILYNLTVAFAAVRTF